MFGGFGVFGGVEGVGRGAAKCEVEGLSGLL